MELDFEGGFSQEMRALLAGMKGKVLKSFTCNLAGKPDSLFTISNFRINLGRSSIEVTNDFHGDVVFWNSSDEEMAWFECEEVDPKSRFAPRMGYVGKRYLVDEVITRVGLVADTVDFENGSYIAKMDMALVIGTGYTTFTFARSDYLFEVVNIAVDGPNAEPSRLEPIETWDSFFDSETGTPFKVSVKRDYEEL